MGPVVPGPAIALSILCPRRRITLSYERGDLGEQRPLLGKGKYRQGKNSAVCILLTKQTERQECCRGSRMEDEQRTCLHQGSVGGK